MANIYGEAETVLVIDRDLALVGLVRRNGASGQEKLMAESGYGPCKRVS